MYGLSDSLLNGADYFALPERLFQNKINKVVLYLGNKKIEVVAKKPFVATINRRELNEWLHEEAKKEHANIVFGSSVSEIGQNYVVTGNRKKIYFNYLVGADGSNSIVRKHLKLKNNRGIGVQFWFEDIKKEIEIHLDYEKFGPWYGWVVPHKGKVSIGTGGDLDVIPLEKMKKI